MFVNPFKVGLLLQVGYSARKARAVSNAADKIVGRSRFAKLTP